MGALAVDIAYGAIISSLSTRRRSASRFVSDEARNLAETGVCVIAAANDQLGFTHPEVTGWDHISFFSSPGPLTCEGNELQGSKAVAVRSGKIDRSSRRGLQRSHGHFERARAHGEGDVYRARSIIGSELICRIVARRPRLAAGQPSSRPFLEGLGSPA